MMRYAIFTTRAGGKPVCAVPWFWLANALAAIASIRCRHGRIEDAYTDATLMQWDTHPMQVRFDEEPRNVAGSAVYFFARRDGRLIRLRLLQGQEEAASSPDRH